MNVQGGQKIMSDEIKSIDELRKAQAAAQAQGASVPNYSRWEQVLEDLDTAGVQSTGSYEGDMQLHNEMMSKLESFIEQTQQAEEEQQMNPKNDETSKVDNKTSQDKENVIKANVANGTSSMILADYMKYYHLMG